MPEEKVSDTPETEPTAPAPTSPPISDAPNAGSPPPEPAGD